MDLEQVLRKYARELARALEECGCTGIKVEHSSDPVRQIISIVMRAEDKCRGQEIASCVMDKMKDAVKKIVMEAVSHEQSS